MTIIQAVVLGAVQGATEFLPISSSAHLLLVPWLLGWPPHSLTFDVALHMGTLAAVLAVFWRDVLDLAVAALRDRLSTRQGRLAWGIAAATVPAAAAGFLFDDFVEAHLRSPLIPAFTLATLGVALWLADRAAAHGRGEGQVGLVDLLWIGVAQALALVPGVSRSGITITAGLLRGLDRETAARISFLLSIPTIAGAGLLKLKDVAPAELGVPFYAGVVAAAVAGYLVIRYMLDYLRRGTYAAFALYRVALAAVVVAAWYTGLRSL